MAHSRAAVGVRRQWKRRAAGEQGVGVLQARDSSFWRVELKPLYRAGERSPEFLVEMIEMGWVGAVFQFDLVESIGAGEFPSVFFQGIQNTTNGNFAMPQTKPLASGDMLVKENRT